MILHITEGGDVLINLGGSRDSIALINGGTYKMRFQFPTKVDHIYKFIIFHMLP